MTKRIIAALLVLFMILVFSVPAFADSSVTIPVSGAWKFHDTLVFSSLSSSITQTVNFLSDGVPYTSMLVSSGSLSYAKSTGVTHVYGVEQSMILYAPDSAYTQYAIIEYANIDSGNRTSSYFIRWFPSSSASVSSRIDNNGTSSTYQLVSSGGYVSEKYSSLESAVSAIQSSDTTYSWSAHPDIAYLYVIKNGTYSVNNAVPYSSINISVPNQVKTTNCLISGNWSIVSFSERSANKIDDAEIVRVIGEGNDDVVETAGFQDSSYKTIQFGQTPQEVSAEFYSWLVRNASPLVSSIVDADGDGYDDESYNAGQQAGYTVGFADGQSSTDSYDLGYSIGYDTGLNDGQSISQEQVYNNGYNKGYEAGYNVGKDFSKNQAADAETVGNFFVRMLSAITSFLLYLGINISFRGVTILSVLFFVIIAVIVWLVIRKLLGGGD